VGTRNDDISLILAKAKKQGFLPDVSDSEVAILSTEAQNLFGSDNVIPSPPSLVHYDIFDRADGSPGTAPSGQTYITHQTNNQLPKIVNKQLVSQSQDGTSTGSGYIAVNFSKRPSVLTERGLIFGTGSGQNSSMSIVCGGREDGQPVTTVNEIIDRCLHLILTRTGISVQYRDAVNGEPVSGPTWALSLPRNDGTEYEWQIRFLSDDTIQVIDPLGGSNVLTDPRVAKLSGRSVYWQAVNLTQATPTPGDETKLTGIWTHMGDPNSIPKTEQFYKHPLNGQVIGSVVKNQSGFASDRFEVFSREIPTASGGLVDGRLQLTYFTPVSEFIVNRIETYTGATAVSGASLIKFGLYEVDLTGNLNLLAVTFNDNTLLGSANNATSKAIGDIGLPSNYRLKPGKRYAVGVLVVGSTNAGTVHGATVNTVLSNITPGKLNGTVTGLTDIPTTIAVGSIGTSSLRPYFRFWGP
jgi:hypothetical protein